jgi:hypothetical protein
MERQPYTIISRRYQEFSPSPIPSHVPYGLRGLPSRLWPKCNLLLRLGCTWGAVTLSQWYEWWYVWAWSTRRGLKPKFCKLPRPWSLWGSSPARENSHGRTGKRTRELMVSSQKLWPPSHDACRTKKCLRWRNFPNLEHRKEKNQEMFEMKVLP